MALSEVRNTANNALYWQANTVTVDGQIDKETLDNSIVTLRVYAHVVRSRRRAAAFYNFAGRARDERYRYSRDD